MIWALVQARQSAIAQRMLQYRNQTLKFTGTMVMVDKTLWHCATSDAHNTKVFYTISPKGHVFMATAPTSGDMEVI